MKGQRERVASNFHEFRMEGIAPGTLYRSSHPITDASTEDTREIAEAAEKARIAAVLNLCDTKTFLIKIVKIAPWYHRLFKANKVIALDMGFDFLSTRFCTKLRRGIQFMLTNKGPYLLHCHAGIDRTGFVCAVLGALMGAKLSDIVRDYIASYNDKSLIDEYPEFTGFILEDFRKLNGGEEITDANLQGAAEDFLEHKVKLTRDEIAELKEKLTIKRKGA
ncbi:hypothetical protein FACS1894106_0180 [Spirochaetia bacterium]|nr:hypothetical protein FACS1894106_0180 [Spirochaetia bacterium]